MSKEQLRSIFERHALTVEKLAEAAEVAQSLVTDMLDGIPVTQGLATRVLSTLSSLTNRRYLLDNVEITVKQETPPGSEVARLIEEIDLQTDALIQGLSGFAEGSSRHEIIHARWQSIIDRYQHLLEQAHQTNP